MLQHSRAATLQVLVLDANFLFANGHMKFALYSVYRAVLSSFGYVLYSTCTLCPFL